MLIGCGQNQLGRRSIAMNNEHFGYAVPERSRRAVQAINNEQLRVRAEKCPFHFVISNLKKNATNTITVRELLLIGQHLYVKSPPLIRGI